MIKGMMENHVRARVLHYKPEGGRGVKRLKVRWLNGVREDLRKLDVKNWWTVAKDKDGWGRIPTEADARTGL